MKMKSVFAMIISIMGCLLVACSAVNLPVKNTYQLMSYSSKVYAKRVKNISILVSVPDAVAAYQTEEMLYIKKPFELMPFANNAWVSPPATMIYPLIMQSLQRSNYFYAITSSPYADQADYRLDTQILKLHQNFLCLPSQMELAVKVVLSRISDSQVIASKIIQVDVPSPASTPYGGVIAANKGMNRVTAEITEFVVQHSSRQRSYRKP